MGGVNRGKQFETLIYKALSEVKDSTVERVPDPLGGLKGVANFCDFNFYQHPNRFYFECKTIMNNTLSFKTNISQGQWDGLLERANVKGVRAGIIVWFQGWDTTVYVPILELDRMRQLGIKSLNIKDIINKVVRYAIIPGEKKRVLSAYHGSALIKSVNDLTEALDADRNTD